MAKGLKTGGRQRGVPNKKTAAVKEALDMAFQQIGGVKALVKWGKENPTPFYQAWVKLLPLKAELSGEVIHKHQIWKFGDNEVAF